MFLLECLQTTHQFANLGVVMVLTFSNILSCMLSTKPKIPYCQDLLQNMMVQYIQFRLPCYNSMTTVTCAHLSNVVHFCISCLMEIHKVWDCHCISSLESAVIQCTLSWRCLVEFAQRVNYITSPEIPMMSRCQYFWECHLTDDFLTSSVT